MTPLQLLGLAFFVMVGYLFIGALLALLLAVCGERNPRGSEWPEWKVAGAIIVAWPLIFLGVFVAWEPLNREGAKL